jgi:hypothetical protein
MCGLVVTIDAKGTRPTGRTVIVADHAFHGVADQRSAGTAALP